MKKTKLTRSLLAACSIVALSVVLSGCLHSGSDDTATTTPTDPTTPTTPPASTADSLKADAADAITDALAAGMAAKQAEMDAIKYAGMLTAEAVHGDSSMAVMNAQMILNAEMAAKDAVMDADDALNDAMEAKTKAEALPADDADRAGAIAAAERAIEQATAQKKAAQAILDKTMTDPADTVDTLMEAVAEVKGSNKLAEGYPMMPAAIGKRIASEVMTAIGTATPGTGGTLAETTPMGGIMNDGADIGAMTWAMIVGEDNVMDVRRFDTSAISEVKAMSVMGSMASDLATATATLPADSDTEKDGIQNADGANYDAAYMGIDGTVFCAGSDCGRDADGNLTGSWYFTPDSTTTLFVKNPDMPAMYMVATMYATYGYWLTYDDTTDAATGIALYATSTANQASLDLGQAGTGDDATDVTATYSGSAVGISARGDESGQFTAGVRLTAKFAETPTLRGQISNFQGDAVGNWTVILNETTLVAAANFASPGTTAGGGAAGTWTAQGYGPAPINHDGDDGTTPLVPQRPEGFFGHFSASFGDGTAAGAYATRADDQ